jgi:hypothetical protein
VDIGEIHLNGGGIRVDIDEIHVDIGEIHLNGGAIHVDIDEIHVDIGEIHVNGGLFTWILMKFTWMGGHSCRYR